MRIRIFSSINDLHPLGIVLCFELSFTAIAILKFAKRLACV